MRCTCRASVHHQPGCPEYDQPGERYGWHGWEHETELGNSDDRAGVDFLTITRDDEEVAVIIHRHLPNPRQDRLARARKQRDAEEMVRTLNITEEERTILAHYRGDCHNSAACPACSASRSWQDRDAEQACIIGGQEARLAVQSDNIATLQRRVATLEDREQGSDVTNDEGKVLRHARGLHEGMTVPGCAMCALRKSRDSAEAKVRTQEGTIRRQTATITALEAGVRDAQQRLNSIIEG